MKRLIALVLMIGIFGVNINAFSGEIVPTATSRPTEVCPYEFYEHDFSGTRNYTYSQYLVDRNDVVIIYADNKFEVSTYYPDGKRATTIAAEKQQDGTYRISFGTVGLRQDYYFVIYNKSGKAMTNAIYTIAKNSALYQVPIERK